MSNRPELVVEVGAELFVRVVRNRVSELIPVRVVKVARVYATVEPTDGRRYFDYTEYKIDGGGRRLTPSESRYGSSHVSHQLVTQQQIDHDERLAAARARIYAAGFEPRMGHRPDDADVIAMAHVLRTLDTLRTLDEKGND